MALRYPGAAWDPLGPQTEPAMTAHDILCFHTMVGSLAGTSNMFHENGYGGTESHFGVGAVGETEQWQDLMHEADANLDGRHRVVSIETADYGGAFGTWNTGNPDNVPAWTSAQLDRLVDMTVWFCRKETHAGCPADWACHKVGVPCALIPDTKPGRRGLSYHKQGCDPYRVDGGEKWSTSYGKVCPADRRIAQLKSIVIPRAQRILAGGDTTEEFTVSQFEDIMALLGKIDRDATNRYADVANRVQAVLNEERARYNDYVGRFNAVLADLAADPDNPITPADAEQFREMAATVDRIEQALAVEPPAVELPKA